MTHQASNASTGLMQLMEIKHLWTRQFTQDLPTQWVVFNGFPLQPWVPGRCAPVHHLQGALLSCSVEGLRLINLHNMMKLRRWGSSESWLQLSGAESIVGQMLPQPLKLWHLWISLWSWTQPYSLKVLQVQRSMGVKWQVMKVSESMLYWKNNIIPCRFGIRNLAHSSMVQVCNVHQSRNHADRTNASVMEGPKSKRLALILYVNIHSQDNQGSSSHGQETKINPA